MDMLMLFVGIIGGAGIGIMTGIIGLYVIRMIKYGIKSFNDMDEEIKKQQKEQEDEWQAICKRHHNRYGQRNGQSVSDTIFKRDKLL